MHDFLFVYTLLQFVKCQLVIVLRCNIYSRHNKRWKRSGGRKVCIWSTGILTKTRKQWFETFTALESLHHLLLMKRHTPTLWCHGSTCHQRVTKTILEILTTFRCVQFTHYNFPVKRGVFSVVLYRSLNCLPCVFVSWVSFRDWVFVVFSSVLWSWGYRFSVNYYVYPKPLIPRSVSSLHLGPTLPHHIWISLNPMFCPLGELRIHRVLRMPWFRDIENIAVSGHPSYYQVAYRMEGSGGRFSLHLSLTRMPALFLLFFLLKKWKSPWQMNDVEAGIEVCNCRFEVQKFLSILENDSAYI